MVTVALVALVAPAAMASGYSAPGAGAQSYDISFPQCGGAFFSSTPGGLPFGIVGVNDGRPNTANPCLGSGDGASELSWDLATGYPMLYVNTADPGNSYHHQLTAGWPTSSISSDPYGGTGACTTVPYGHGPNATLIGANTTACAWQYGYNMAQVDEQGVASALSQVGSSLNPGSFPYWLDVETANTWLTGTYGLEMNTAVLQGMAYYFAYPTTPTASGTTTGVYSTSYQWGQITGTPSTSTLGSLENVPNWIPGVATSATASTLAGSANCGQTSFTGGAVDMLQWTVTYDQDVVCTGSTI